MAEAALALTSSALKTLVPAARGGILVRQTQRQLGGTARGRWPHLAQRLRLMAPTHARQGPSGSLLAHLCRVIPGRAMEGSPSFAPQPRGP